ncbi:MAG: hypothetical protein VX278_06690, partial [Myxococcota bacterium]|nr:hypothetical protein [Myxococcota bacterium]
PFLSRNYMKSTDAIMWEVTDASLRVNLYEDDLAANQHPFLPGPDGKPGGIAQMYALAKDRRNIYSNDYWVSTDWRRISCGPFRSRLKIQSLSSSGSTMFVISEKGDMFTRYWNYNTSGASAPTNLYTLDPERSKPGNFFTTRLLPTEPWYQQPPINGQITDRISIFSTGHAGNQARLLRVEGKKGGRTGYFEKLIYEPDWRFVPTDVSVDRPFMDNQMRDESSIQSLKDDGLILSEEELHFVGQLGEFSIRLHDFHLNCAPAYLEIQYQGVSVFLIVHAALESPISSKKGNYYRKRGEVNRYRIYMELPEQYWDPNMNSLEVRTILRYLKQRWKHDDGRYFWGHVHASEDKAMFKPKRSLGGLFAPGKASLLRMEQTKAAD